MPSIRIKNFKGINLKANPSDMADHQCQVLKNFSLSEEPGTLKKITGYSERFDDYPSGLTIKSMYEFRVSKPSIQNIFVLYGLDGTKDEIWIRPYWDGSQWVDSWQELTEAEGTLTAEAGTNTTTIVCSGLASSVDDYYNGWVITSDTRNTQAMVSDYVGSTKTLTLTQAISGQTTGDTFRIERFNMYHPFESGTLATNTTTTVAFINDLKGKASDYYEGWYLYNSTRGQTRQVTSYDNVAGSLTLASAITGQVATDGFELYYSQPILSVDDKIRYTQRQDSLVMSVGNDSGYPTQAPLWFGYIDRRYFGSTNSDNNDWDGFYLCRNVLDKPDSGIVSLGTTGGDLGDDYPDTYYVRAAYIYDGYQIGPMSEAVSQLVGAGQDLTVQAQIGLDKPNNMYFADIMSRRITGLYFFIAKGANADDKWEYYYLKDLVIASDNPELLPLSDWTVSSGVWSSPTLQLDSSGWSEQLYEPDIKPTTQRNLLYESGTSRERRRRRTGHNYINRGDYWDIYMGHNSIYIDVNYIYSQLVQGYSFVAPVYADQKEESVLYRSAINGYGVMCPDIYPRKNYIKLSDYGIREVTGIALMVDRLVIFSKTDILKLMISSGNEFSWELDETFQDEGCDAPDTIRYVEGMIFYKGQDGVRYFDGNTSRLVPGTYELFNDLTTTTDAIAGYYKNKKQYWISFPTEQKIYFVDLITGEYDVCEFEYPTTINWITELADGDMCFTNGSAIYNIDTSYTFGAWTNKITPQWKSKVYDAGSKDLEMVLKQIALSYKSNTDILFQYYRNRDGVARSLNNSPFIKTTNEVNKICKFPFGERGEEYEFEITLDSTDVESNTELTINEAIIEFDTVPKRLR